jgi:CDGSH-type Zn-finger protein
MTPLQLIALPNGPDRVDGEVEVLDADGRALPAPEASIHTCRCGRSASKPFCDGSHARTERKNDE